MPRLVGQRLRLSAWMDERVMRMWVDKVLKPFVDDVPENITPLLLLDSYRCHTMASVKGDIEVLGVEVQIIPGGCTGMCQPVDVGIGKPLKTRARHLWEEWMVSEVSNNPDGPCRHASREQMSQWIYTSFNEIKLSNRMIAYNSWRHHLFTYFPNEPARAAVAPLNVPVAAAAAVAPPVVPADQVLAASLVPERQQDPGWDDTDNSTFE
jgi:DDE superfamily endonuclease